MACTPIPTQTLYDVLTTSTESTSFSELITTIPAVVSTALSTFCALSTVDSDGNTTCVMTQTEEVITTIQDATVSTTQSPFVVDVPVTESLPTATLFSTCPTANSTTLPPPPPPPPPPTSPPDSSSTTPFSTQISSTLANGSVVVTWVTATSTLPPTTSVIPGPPGGAEDSHHGNDIGDNLGPVIGGALGGFAGLILLVTIVWFIWRKRYSFGAFKDEPIDFDPSLFPAWPGHQRGRSPPPTAEPKPYEYGLVGRKATPSRDSSPSPSPAPTRPQSLAFSGLSPGPYSPGFPLGPPTPNSGLGPSPYTPTFPQQQQTPAQNYMHTSPPMTPTPDGPGMQQQRPPSYVYTSPPGTPTPERTPTPVGPLPFPSTQLQSRPQLGPQPLPQAQPDLPPTNHRASASVTSVGTAVSYPYPVLPPLAHLHESAGIDGAGSDDVSNSSVGEQRRPVRLSLTLANWNPETDGELFSRASVDEDRPRE